MEEIYEMFGRLEQLHDDLQKASMLRKVSIAEEIGHLSIDLTSRVIDTLNEVVERLEELEG